MKTLELKNFMVRNLAEFLAELQLHGKESRARTRFIKILSERAQEGEEERIRMCKEYSAKDGDKLVYFDAEGNETTDEDKMKRFKIENVEAFNSEYNKYLNESFKIDVSEANSETIYGVRDILLNTTVEFDKETAPQYDMWCSAFESIA